MSPPTYTPKKYARVKDLSSARWVIVLVGVAVAGFLLYRLISPAQPRPQVQSDAGAVLNAKGQARGRR